MNQYFCLLLAILCSLGFSSLWAQPTALEQIQKEVMDVMSKVSPSVVEIQCETDVKARRSYHFQWSHHRDREEKEFLLEGPSSKKNREDSGIGLILDKEGHILTSHFVQDAKKITVKLLDGRIFQAEMKGTDDKMNIALLKIQAENLQPVILGDSDRAVPGTLILAFGNPYGMGYCSYFGMVSAPVRFIKSQPRLPITIPVYPGDKGGALFDISGKVIGIIDGVVSGEEMPNKIFEFRMPSFKGKMKKFQKNMREFGDRIKKKIEEKLDREGILESEEEEDEEEEKEEKRHSEDKDLPVPFPSFSCMPGFPKGTVSMALPINLLKPSIESLKTKGKIERGWLGVRVAPVPEGLKAHFPSLQNTFALQIEGILSGSPAEEAGLKQWDIILEFADHTFSNIEQFKRIVEESSGPTNIKILRGAEIKTMKVTISSPK